MTATLIAMCVLVPTGCAPSSKPQLSILEKWMAKSCDEIVAERRRVVRTLASFKQDGGAGARATAGLLLGSGSAASVTRKETERLEAEEFTANEAISRKQCTTDARVQKAGTSIANDSSADGVYSGKARTESWCQSPTMSLTLHAGAITGSLSEGGSGARSRAVSGILYSNGEASLKFAAKKAGDVTEVADAVVKDGSLTTVVYVDLSPQNCSYRFALARQP